jgi:hypothetical protein
MDLTNEMATKWIMFKWCRQHEYTGKGDDLYPGKEGTGQCEILYHYSKPHAVVGNYTTTQPLPSPAYILWMLWLKGHRRLKPPTKGLISHA